MESIWEDGSYAGVLSCARGRDDHILQMNIEPVCYYICGPQLLSDIQNTK